MQVTLYQAAETVRHLLEQIDSDTGELPEGFEQSRSIVANKAQAVAAFILANEAEADLVETHAKALIDKAKKARKRSEWLRQYLSEHMNACGITEIKSDDGTFKAQLFIDRGVSVEAFNISQIPMEYMVEKISWSPDKNLIKKNILNGVDVPGAKLVSKNCLTIK